MFTAQQYALITVTVILCLMYMSCAIFVFTKRKTIYRDIVPFVIICNCIIFALETMFLSYTAIEVESVCFLYLWFFFICGIMTGAGYAVKCLRVITQFYCEFIETRGKIHRNASRGDTISDTSHSYNNSDSDFGGYLSPSHQHQYQYYEAFNSGGGGGGDGGDSSNALEPLAASKSSHSIRSKENRKETVFDLIEHMRQKHANTLNRVEGEVREVQEFLENHKFAWFVYRHRHWNSNRNLVKIFFILFAICLIMPIFINIHDEQYRETPWEPICSTKSPAEYTLLIILVTFFIACFITALILVRRLPRTMFMKRHLMNIGIAWIIGVGIVGLAVVSQFIIQSDTFNNVLQFITFINFLLAWFAESVDPLYRYYRHERKRKRFITIIDNIKSIQDVLDPNPSQLCTTADDSDDEEEEEEEEEENSGDYGVRINTLGFNNNNNNNKDEKELKMMKKIRKKAMEYFRYFLIESQDIEEHKKGNYKTRLDFIHYILNSRVPIRESDLRRDDDDDDASTNNSTSQEPISESEDTRDSFSTVTTTTTISGGGGGGDVRMSSSNRRREKKKEKNDGDDNAYKLVTGHIVKIWLLFFKHYFTLDDSVVVLSEAEMLRSARKNTTSKKHRFYLEEKYIIPISKCDEEVNVVGDLRSRYAKYLYSISYRDYNEIVFGDEIIISRVLFKMMRKNIKRIDQDIFTRWKRSPQFIHFVEYIYKLLG